MIGSVRESISSEAKMTAKIKYDDNGLVAAVVQDAETRELLMVAYMNETALERTLATGEMHYWSRSRRELWHKGERSGHVQLLKEARVDCDQDCLLFLVEQRGAACHMGYHSCFYRAMEPDGSLKVVEERLFDPDKVYGETS